MFVHKKTDGGWGWTVAHEIGHWFGLYHTFRGSGDENVTRDPNAPGFNCETYGDELCSTPADYGTDWCDEPEDDCECTDSGEVDDCGNAQGTTGGSHTDAYGVPYDLDFLNIMAYGCRPCAHTWTGEQVDRQWVYLAYRLKQDNITHASCMGNVTAGTLDPTQTIGTRIEAVDFIQSTQNIETNQYVLYDAANNVFLLPGFTAEKTNGVQPDFEIVNEGCYGEYQLTTPQSTVFRAKHAHEEKEVSGEGGQR